jgi:hypothetical protein
MSIDIHIYPLSTAHWTPCIPRECSSKPMRRQACSQVETRRDCTETLSALMHLRRLYPPCAGCATIVANPGIDAVAYPPLNAPTGFFTATGATTSCLSSDEFWNERVGKRAAKERELDARREDSILDAIVVLCAGISGSTNWSCKTIECIF